MEQYLNWLEGLIQGDSPLVFIVVFAIGFISSLSPHMISMVMMFTAYFVDKDIESKKKTILRSMIFSICFVSVLIVLTIIIKSIGRSIPGLMKISFLISSIILLVLGFRLLGIRLLRNINPIKVTYMYVSNNKSLFSPMYLLFSILFTHCSIPFVLSILTLAALKDSVIYSLMLVILFGFGHSLIFMIGGISTTALNKFRKNNKVGKILIKVYGLVLVILSVSLMLKFLTN